MGVRITIVSFVPLKLLAESPKIVISSAAKEGWMVLLEEVVAMFPREEAGGFLHETSES